MTTIVSIEGSTRIERIELFRAMKVNIQSEKMIFFEEYWELPDSFTQDTLDVIRECNDFISRLMNLLESNQSHIVVTLFSPFLLYHYCLSLRDSLSLSDTNRILYDNIITLLESNLLQIHDFTIRISPPTSHKGKEFLLAENRTLVEYRPLMGIENDLYKVSSAILNYMGFVKLAEERREKFLVENKKYKPGVNYGKVSYFDKFGRVSSKVFYSGDISFPYGITCFTTVFHF